MSNADTLKRRSFGETARIDAWWLKPGLVFVGLTAFIAYATWAGMQGKHYFYDGGGAHLLSPFYSPLLYGQAHEPRLFAAELPSWWPSFLPFSAAILILAGPAGMRVTCYYYRGAYYKSFWADPVACGVGEPRKSYWGEHRIPLLLHNAHRYFFYVAGVYVFILFYDGLRALVYVNPDGSHSLGIGVGSIVLLLNACFLAGYTFGCHCHRHLLGGHLRIFAKAPVQHACYQCISMLNRRHMYWAWVSLVWVGFSDLYVRMCAMGVWTDWRIF
ncbi:MAG: succinate dehydrogenase [Candidatus Hydrogenedentes bacterium]|nr:succinate dehydrogenase [Candidatus Hydrogenedentota bacterium]